MVIPLGRGRNGHSIPLCFILETKIPVTYLSITNPSHSPDNSILENENEEADEDKDSEDKDSRDEEDDDNSCPSPLRFELGFWLGFELGLGFLWPIAYLTML